MKITWVGKLREAFYKTMKRNILIYIIMRALIIACGRAECAVDWFYAADTQPPYQHHRLLPVWNGRCDHAAFDAGRHS